MPKETNLNKDLRCHFDVLLVIAICVPNIIPLFLGVTGIVILPVFIIEMIDAIKEHYQK